MDKRLKASFGTALKFYDAKNVGDTSLVAVLTIIAFLLTPPSGAFVNGITSPQLWLGLHQRLLPNDNWFGLYGTTRHVSQDQTKPDLSRITTSSITQNTGDTNASIEKKEALLPDK